ncbi:hypothetical protein GCM10007198_03650 [Microbacterium aerolatum]|uniref:Uncharacterized protein n=1 Tax=Microbacterium aerolatum TaxID=153731 RepID=A0A511ADJ2_9MICO|nr:hypothetical protein MAE01_14110 [Microbacterium aerolatum]GGB16328.1 hypothetical protein GCM10007198_03650 [Microbacterium aerolatum]
MQQNREPEHPHFFERSVRVTAPVEREVMADDDLQASRNQRERQRRNPSARGGLKFKAQNDGSEDSNHPREAVDDGSSEPSPPLSH